MAREQADELEMPLGAHPDDADPATGLSGREADGGPRPTGIIAAAESEAAATLLEGMLLELRSRVSLFVFRGHFEPLLPLRLDDELLTLVAPSAFHRDWLRDHYARELDEAASSAAGHDVRVTVIHDERLVPREQLEAARAAAPPAQGALTSPSSARAPAVAPAPAPRRLEAAPGVPRVTRAEPVRGRLASGYTFDSFITGGSNHMAWSACHAVAEHPASRYSPLFLFGGTGLGKTHLLHAIGNAVLRTHPGLRVVYMSAEEWVNEYITEIRHRRFDEFRARYRNGCDVLLLDDIQFLAGKDSSQDEFFHTFNSLYAARRQIVVTSDRYPHEIEGLEERLKTRLQWGLIADVQPPDMETRVAILETKAESTGMDLDHDVACFLATRIVSSVRELEGALTRLHAWATLTGERITLDHAREQLRAVLGERRALSLGAIIKAVAAYYDVRPADLSAKTRQRQITLARQVAMFLARKHLGHSLPELGRAFGGRDHTTVLASVRKIEALLAKDAGMQAVVSRLERALGGESLQ
jgi:chromosomal replication initiator protein